MCPVHTPDGAPCGLLNHLAANCVASVTVKDTSAIPGIMFSLGMTSANAAGITKAHLVVMLDGKVGCVCVCVWVCVCVCVIESNVLKSKY